MDTREHSHSSQKDKSRQERQVSWELDERKEALRSLSKSEPNSLSCDFVQVKKVRDSERPLKRPCYTRYSRLAASACVALVDETPEVNTL